MGGRGGEGDGAKGENEGVGQLEQVHDEEMENNILGTELWALAGFSRNVQIGRRFSQRKCAAAAGTHELLSTRVWRVDVSFAFAVGRRPAGASRFLSVVLRLSFGPRGC